MRSFPIFILIFIISGAVNAQKTIIFEWRSSTIEGKSFPRSAMMVPVHFPEDTTTYYLQFDTGAHYSTLYSKRTSKIELEEETIKTSLGEVKFRKNEVMSPSKEKNASIGTLGSDFLAGKIVLIDFKNLQIKFLKSSSIKGFALVPMKLLEGRPCLNINLDKKIETVLYDTGSSLFGLWTNKRDWQKNKRHFRSP